MIFQYSSIITADFQSKMLPESMCYGQVTTFWKLGKWKSHIAPIYALFQMRHTVSDPIPFNFEYDLLTSSAMLPYEETWGLMGVFTVGSFDRSSPCSTKLMLTMPSCTRKL